MGLDKSACANQSQKLLDDGQPASYRSSVGLVSINAHVAMHFPVFI